MKFLALTLLLGLNFPAFAHGPGSHHLTFANGDYHAHVQFTSAPQGGVKTELKVDWKRGSDHAPIAAPGAFIVEPRMCHKPGSCHGTIENSGPQQVLDNKGVPVVGSYIVRDIQFSMNGLWNIDVIVQYPQGDTETQTFDQNVGQHGGHGGHKHRH